MSLFDVRIEQIHTFLLLLTRCSGIFVFTPFLSSFNVPAQVRILLSVALSYLLSLSAPLILSTPLNILSLIIGLSGELVVGLAIGLSAHALFAGLQYAGQLIGFQMGLSFVNAVDPQTSNRSMILSVYQNYLGLMLFLGFNAHHWFIEAIAKSISTLPPYSVNFSEGFTTKMAEVIGQLFIIGFQLSAPVMAVLILTDVVLGIIGRSAPQIQILIIGFPVKVLIGLSGMGLALYFLPAAMRGFSVHFYRDINSLVRLLGN